MNLDTHAIFFVDLHKQEIRMSKCMHACLKHILNPFPRRKIRAASETSHLSCWRKLDHRGSGNKSSPIVLFTGWIKKVQHPRWLHMMTCREMSVLLENERLSQPSYKLEHCHWVDIHMQPLPLLSVMCWDMFFINYFILYTINVI